MEFDPFQCGFIFWEDNDVERFGPPDDDEGQREWLAGFQQAFADYPDDPLNPEAGETTGEALNRLLPGHPALPALLTLLRPC